MFTSAANVHWFRSGTKYGKSLTITGNNEKSGYKTAGKIGEILGKIDKSEFITRKTYQMLKETAEREKGEKGC